MTYFRLFFQFMVTAFLAGVGPLPMIAHAQSATEQDIAPAYEQRADELLKILQGSEKEEEFFAPSFRSAVPVPQFRALLGQLRSQYGEPQSIHKIVPASPADGTVEILYEKALVAMRMVIDSDPPQPVIGLLITGASMREDDLAKISEEFRKLPGTAAFAITDVSGETAQSVAGHQSTRQMAVGSTTKLYVLAELARSVEAGERQWNDVTTLSQKSLPSGMLQNWPDDTPLTLQTLATLMISISDNSATDILIKHLGRANIGKLLTQIGHGDHDRTLPFLTTVEAFALKMPTREALRNRYVNASEQEQTAILVEEQDKLGLASTSAGNLATIPRHIDTVEWFASPEDVNRLLHYLARTRDPVVKKIMRINSIIPPGDAKRWAYLGGKGGSEPGVIAFAFLASANSGKTYAVSGSWNNNMAPVDNDKFLSLMNRMLNIIATR